MSRVWVVQSKEIAVSIARMKKDANFIGIASEEEQQEMIDNHVFLREVWDEGGLSEKRIQRLYHNIFEGDIVICPSILGEDVINKIVKYSKENGALVVFCLYDELTLNSDITLDLDFVIHYGQVRTDDFSAHICLSCEESINKAIGTILMILSISKKAIIKDYNIQLIKKAESMKEIPWYDEIVYMRT